jgi:hypothetical protein
MGRMERSPTRRGPAPADQVTRRKDASGPSRSMRAALKEFRASCCWDSAVSWSEDEHDIGDERDEVEAANSDSESESGSNVPVTRSHARSHRLVRKASDLPETRRRQPCCAHVHAQAGGSYVPG